MRSSAKERKASSKKATNRGKMLPNKQVAPKTNKQQTHKGKIYKNMARPRSKQTSMDPNITHGKEQT